MSLSRKALIAHALRSSFFRPTQLRAAVERLGFVQADPIRAPARAQDLILRHRVKDYRAGDLEKRYARLGFEEDFVYAYGFVPPSTWRLLHPRASPELTEAEQQVLELVSSRKRMHPQELEAHLGREREVNAWGGYSKTTTRILERLHYRGLLRVAGRVKGIRLYTAMPARLHESLDPEERLRRLVLLMARLLAPVPERSLQETCRFLGRAAPDLERRFAVAKLVTSGDLTSGECDGTRYVWPAGKLLRKRPENVVRFLAPFDPLVWDRRRFEHLWGWQYRFEAYTPESKRKLGYYAMPLLWRDEVIGWANVSRLQGKLNVNTGYVHEEPRDPEFASAFRAEVERLKIFLAPR